MQQITFTFSTSNKYDFDELIESDSNKIACHTINNWKNYWGVEPYPRSLIIKGDKFSGKTFLAKKWVKETDGLFIKKTQELTSNILSSYQSFVIDDFDKYWNEEKILHIFNILAENKKYLLITCTSLPEIKLPDLSSRIRSVNLITIKQPDDQMMKMLIFKLFSNYSVVTSKEVIKFLVAILPREFPAIIGSVKAINEFALENKRKITIPTIKKALNFKK